MLEIVFEQCSDNCFLGHPCQSVKIDTGGDDFGAYRKKAAEIVTAYGNETALLIDFSGTDEQRNRLALALDIETYEQNQRLESAIFKVKDSIQALRLYKPYMALANSLRYARDLYRLSEEEMYADIKRLGYLGLKIGEDYLKEEIQILWPGGSEERILTAMGKAEAVIAVGFVKTMAICKYPVTIKLIIFRNKQGRCLSEEQIINEIITKVGKENEKR